MIRAGMGRRKGGVGGGGARGWGGGHIRKGPVDAAKTDCYFVGSCGWVLSRK